mgnify:CR=1 FL=1
MKTKVFFDNFKGHKMFAVWEVDESSNKVGQYPLFSMGAKKAIALMYHLEEFKDYVSAVNNSDKSNYENKRYE